MLWNLQTSIYNIAQLMLSCGSQDDKQQEIFSFILSRMFLQNRDYEMRECYGLIKSKCMIGKTSFKTFKNA